MIIEKICPTGFSSQNCKNRDNYEELLFISNFFFAYRQKRPNFAVELTASSDSTPALLRFKDFLL
jgi:hypothetical protein